jgi:hypothetical protein
MEDKMTDYKIINVGELQDYCEDTDDDCDVFVYINKIPVGFGVEEIVHDFDGSIKLFIKDDGLNYEEKI